MENLERFSLHQQGAEGKARLVEEGSLKFSVYTVSAELYYFQCVWRLISSSFDMVNKC